MNGIYHYYALNFIARKAGFSTDEAHTIAFSSQMVDRALVPLEINLPGGGSFVMPATHHFGFWDKSQEDEVWIPFHFFPSADDSPAPFRDSRKSAVSPWLVRPDSAPVKELLIDALKSRDLYRVGIALHTYADSWAHQNFTGRNAPVNRMEGFSPVPPIGHAQLGRTPDIWSLDWLDARLEGEASLVSNRHRFMDAARMMYRYLCTYLKRGFEDWELVRWELEELILDSESESGNVFPRKNEVRPDHALVLEFRLALECEEFNGSGWYLEALPSLSQQSFLRTGAGERFSFARHEVSKLIQAAKIPPVQAPAGFRQSHLYHWAEAARAHKAAAEKIIRKIA